MACSGYGLSRIESSSWSAGSNGQSRPTAATNGEIRTPRHDRHPCDLLAASPAAPSHPCLRAFGPTGAVPQSLPVEPAVTMAAAAPGRSDPVGHGEFDGPVHAVGPMRDGWGFACACGYRSPLYPTSALAREAMLGHGVQPVSASPRRRWFQKDRVRWPGWPTDRRQRFLR